MTARNIQRTFIHCTRDRAAAVNRVLVSRGSLSCADAIVPRRFDRRKRAASHRISIDISEEQRARVSGVIARARVCYDWRIFHAAEGGE